MPLKFHHYHETSDDTASLSISHLGGFEDQVQQKKSLTFYPKLRHPAFTVSRSRRGFVQWCIISTTFFFSRTSHPLLIITDCNGFHDVLSAHLDRTLNRALLCHVLVKVLVTSNQHCCKNYTQDFSPTELPDSGWFYASQRRIWRNTL